MIYRKTKLYQEHLNLKGNMVPFSGFLLPTHYTSIKEEHLAVRNSAGLFDVSHMGEILIDGSESERFINWIGESLEESLRVFIMFIVGLNCSYFFSRFTYHLVNSQVL
mgnify:CR=1 FL=1